MTRPVTNHQLEALLAEAAFDRAHAAFARQVSREAATRYGLVLRYDGASVYWWLRGRCPEQPTPELMATVLSQRLGRHVAVSDLGLARLAEGDDVAALLFPATIPTAVHTATTVWRRLGSMAPADQAAPFVTLAAADAGWRWHFDPGDHDLARTAGRRVEAVDIAVVRGCGQQFSDLDRRHGSGHARAFLADFLTRDVAPMLRGSYTDPVGRELFAAAAELTGTLAFMAYDTGDHGAAERAFIQALRLAKAAGDRLFGAHILANLATQAIFLELPGEAVRLSRAALDGAGRRPAPLVAARLHTTHANAQAPAGDLQGFQTAIRRAQQAFDKAGHGGPAWARYFTTAHLAGSAMRSLLDLHRPGQALTFEAAALDLSPGNVRTSALHTALAAVAHANAGQLDHAASQAVQALRHARTIKSRRVAERIKALTRALLPHQSLPEVAEFLEQLPSPSP